MPVKRKRIVEVLGLALGWDLGNKVEKERELGFKIGVNLRKAFDGVVKRLKIFMVGVAEGFGILETELREKVIAIFFSWFQISDKNPNLPKAI